MINADMSIPALLHSAAMEWQSSPSMAVSRKRFHLAGEAENGQVTSLVRYEPGASFPVHPHPGGEEILVLSGVFSDETGDWPEGTYLLNPEGFVHSPYSHAGCTLLVKLRQYPGTESTRLSVGSVPVAIVDDVPRQVLYRDESETTVVMTLADKQVVRKAFSGGCEGFVLEGQVKVNGEMCGQYDWFRFPPSQAIQLESKRCSLYLKTGAVGCLWSKS